MMYVCKCPVPTKCNSPHDAIMTSMRSLKRFSYLRPFPVLNSNTSFQPKHKCLKIGSQQNQPMSAHHLLSLKSQSSSPWLKHQWQPTKNMLWMFWICWCIDDLLHPFLTLNRELSFRLDFWTSFSRLPTPWWCGSTCSHYILYDSSQYDDFNCNHPGAKKFLHGHNMSWFRIRYFACFIEGS